MTAPRVYLLQMLHLKRAAFLLDLVQRPLEGTVCWPAADSSSQWVEATQREEGRSSPIKAGVLGSLCKMYYLRNQRQAGSACQLCQAQAAVFKGVPAELAGCISGEVGVAFLGFHLGSSLQGRKSDMLVHAFNP